MLSRLPNWSLVLFGVVAIVLGVIGVTHAPPAVAKVFWTATTIVGLASLALAHRRRQLRRPQVGVAEIRHTNPRRGGARR